MNAALDLLIDGECGIWHLANAGALSWLEFARLIAEESGYDAGRVEGRPTTSFGFDARRPAYSALGSERGTLLPPVEDAIKRYVEAISESQTAELNVPHEAELAKFPAPDLAHNDNRRSRAATGSV